MEPPSPTLSAALRDLRLATPRDLHRAARWCRTIARDLPTFDCVWIDALVRDRLLTRFQAEHLHAGDADRLLIGPYLLLDRLGGDVDAATYLARPLDGGPTRVLKELQVPPEKRAATRIRFETLCGSAAPRIPHVVVPEAVFEAGSRLVVVSRRAEGEGARSVLVRTGRLPGIAVAEIASRLLTGLAETHAAGLPHGDIRVANLVLTRAGEAVLVNHGVRPAVSPILTIDDGRPPEWFDGTAPERIGTAAPATAATDVYALGCLLWHLLAGRSPFATGDPLAKLTSHRTRPVPDVRDYAPEAPPELTRLIAEMTDRDPARRPSDLGESKRSLRRVVRSGRGAVRETISREGETRFPWAIAAALLFALAGASVSLLDQGGTAALLRTTLGDHALDRSSPNRTEATPFAILPPPDETGVLNLEHAGPFAAAEVAFRGPLVLRGLPDRPATIVVTDRPLHLWADEVTLEHVSIVHRSPGASASRPSALVLVESQNLSVRSCRFESPTRPAAERGAAPTALAWRLIDRADPTAGQVNLRDSVFHGTREMVFAADQARSVAVENVLATGQQSLISLGVGRGPTAISLRHLTARDARSVLACRGGAEPVRADVTAENTVFDLGAGGALVAGPPETVVRWRGTGVVSADGLLRSAPSQTRTADASNESPVSLVEGVLKARITFAGPPTGSDAASVARVSGVPRLAGESPGIDLSRLPREVIDLGAPR